MFYHVIFSKLLERAKSQQLLQLKHKWQLWESLKIVQGWVLKWQICVWILPIYVVTDGAMNLNDEEADEETDVDDVMEADEEFYEDVDEDASNFHEIIDLDDTPDTRKS